MALSIWQLLLVAMLFLLLFGRGKIPALMSDLAVGIKNFKSGIKEDNPNAAMVTLSQKEDAEKLSESVVSEKEKV
ncbi:MAG TPA: twin-arginine translocase TatA/TatE family subunit [Methylococcaceae bacterium]|nr:twin-arginine translocase TatA/TatE family subunit [Methylococcaceae bacterium]